MNYPVSFTALLSSATTWFADANAWNTWFGLLRVSVPMPEKVYRALISQAGTAAPTAIVLENTLGVTPVFARTSAGFYTMTAVGAWTADKTFLKGGGPIGNPTSLKMMTLERASADVLNLKTGATDTGVLADMAMHLGSVEIMIYP